MIPAFLTHIAMHWRLSNVLTKDLLSKSVQVEVSFFLGEKSAQLAAADFL
jgi:hypothetical protein